MERSPHNPGWIESVPKGLLIACGVSFLGSTIAFPLIAFGAFSAKDENGWINDLLMLIVAVWLFSGLFFLVMGIVFWIQHRHNRDDTVV